MPGTLAMGNMDMWVHSQPNILFCCRTQHMDPEMPEDAPEELDIEDVKKQIEAKDPYDSRLKPISEDKNVCVSKNIK